MSFVPLETLIRDTTHKTTTPANLKSTSPQVVSLTPHSNLPKFLINDPFTVHGYRFGHSLSEAFHSLFSLHNDTMNVWTHLAPIPFFVWVAFASYESYLSNLTVLQAVGYWMFAYAAVQCLVASACYHLFRCVSPVWAHRLLIADILGVLTLVSFSFLAPLQIVFHCSTAIANAYCIAILVTATLTAIGVLRDLDGKLIVLPVLLVSSAIVPITHYHIEYRLSPAVLAVDANLAVSIGCYALGLVFKTTYFPERVMPNATSFLWVNSHMLWHVCVLGGILTHYLFIFAANDFARNHTCSEMA